MTPLPAAFLGAPIAHRALHDAARPENSLGAIRAAAAAGYGIEIDVQPSADGVAMVFHDNVLDRLTGEAGKVTARDAAALGGLGLMGTAEPIPTLAAALEVLAGRVPLLVELKDQGLDLGTLPEAVAAALAGYRGPVAVMSFNPELVAAMARLAPDVPRGLTTSGFTRMAAPAIPKPVRDRIASIADFGRVGASFVSHDARDLPWPRVAELRAAGTPVLCWTIRSPAEEAAARLHADNITFEGYRPPIPA